MYLGGVVERKTAAYLGATVERDGPAQARVYVFLDRRRGAAPAIALSCVHSGHGSQRGEVAVGGRKLGRPDTVGGGRASERMVEACDVADLRRVEVEQHRRHAALRHVAQRRLPPPPVVPLRAHHARRPRPHASSDFECLSVFSLQRLPKSSDLHRRGLHQSGENFQNFRSKMLIIFTQYRWNREMEGERVVDLNWEGSGL
jgi:hypothetical protein